MTNKYRSAVLLHLLLGLVLFLWSAPAAAQDRPLATPDSAAQSTSTAQAAPDSATSSTLPPGQRNAGHRVSVSTKSGDGVDSFLDFIAFSMFLVFLIAVASAFAGGFGAVAIFTDTGCLRALFFVLGGGVAMISGLVVGLLVGSVIGGEGPFAMVGLFAGGMLYLFAWGWTRNRAQQLSSTDRLTWKHALTGGAIVGTGVGSFANVARSAGALFKGGGGSFGGGGASGGFGGAQAAAAAPVKGAAVKSAAVRAAAPGALAVGTAGSASSPEDSPPGDDAAAVATSSETPSENEASVKQRIVEAFGPMGTWLNAAVRPLRRFRWYHGVAFVLVGLVFMPVGMGVSAILQNGNFLLGLVLVGLSVWAGVAFVTTERFGELRGLAPILVMGCIVASVRLAGYSTAPYWHLAGVAIVVGVVALYRSQMRRSSAAEADAAPFEGGNASAWWR